ncbi:VOC family protein [Sphingomonas sp.]|uniref:VOC family protein n=1 Tax=Sphingomonas sp. TaxID=28214 RepID=UPI003CC510D3
MAMLEHVNLTVRDPERTAALMTDLFGWRERWRGPSQLGGWTIHVGDANGYLALYTRHGADTPADAFAKGRPFNHVGVAVDDLGAIEAKVAAAGLTPFNHGDYEPGRRFYFLDADGIEFEVVSYATAGTAR